MKLAWISSWPPRPCGIATYSADLVRALKEKGTEIHIVCHTDGGVPGEKHVHPVIDTSDPAWDETVYETVNGIKPDVLHIQHEYGLYRTGSDNAAGLFRPLFRFKTDGGFPVVVTYHSVYTVLNSMMSSYMVVMQNLVDAGIVHEEYQRAYLPFNTGTLFSNVYVIPHGAKVVTNVARDEAKKRLGLEGKKIIGMIGWFTPTKGFHRLLGGWDRLSEELGPDTVLVLAGDARTLDPAQQEYKKKLLEMAEQGRFKDRVKIILGSFEPEEYERVLQAFDVMVMPYTFASQSGNLAHSFSLGVPVVATGMEGLKEEIEKSRAGIAVPPGDDEELFSSVHKLITDNETHKRYSRNALSYVKNRIGWPIVADKHLSLYRDLIKSKRAGTAQPVRGKPGKGH
ncbi:MAG TPA: glycosyltransferase [Spirochaetota bacterium]|nr:glycosyltransferase [Spirochaetota bacterium]